MEENKKTNEERKLIGTEPKIAIGLGILLWPIAVIVLCVEQKTMTRAEKAQLIQSLVIGILMTILNCLWVIPYVGFVLGIIGLLVFVLIVYTAIKAFMGEYYEIPWAYNFAMKNFVKFGVDDKNASDEANAKEASVKEENAEANANANADANAEANAEAEVVEEKQKSEEENKEE